MPPADVQRSALANPSVLLAVDLALGGEHDLDRVAVVVSLCGERLGLLVAVRYDVCGSLLVAVKDLRGGLVEHAGQSLDHGLVSGVQLPPLRAAVAARSAYVTSPVQHR
jgi:hypothetical protein